MIKILLITLTILCVSCNDYPPPDIEQCVIISDGLYCLDKRQSEEGYYISFDDALKYIATNPQDYKTMRDYVDLIREKLIKCERRD